MPHVRPYVLISCLICSLGLSLGGCITIVDDDDDAGDSTDAGDGSEQGADSTGGGSSQGRNVRLCEVRVVCEDGSVTEAGQPLCLTAAEAAEQIALIGEACTEDMTAACEDIGDGTSLECGGECSEAMEPCECADPSQGCEI